MCGPRSPRDGTRRRVDLPSRRRTGAAEDLDDAAMSPSGRPRQGRGPWFVVRQGWWPRRGRAIARPCLAGRCGQPMRVVSNGNPRPLRRSSPRRRARSSRIRYDAVAAGRGCHARTGRVAASSAASSAGWDPYRSPAAAVSISGSVNRYERQSLTTGGTRTPASSSRTSRSRFTLGGCGREHSAAAGIRRGGICRTRGERPRHPRPARPGRRGRACRRCANKSARSSGVAAT